MLIDLEKIVGCSGYYIDDQTYEIYSFKQKKDGKKIKLRSDGNGYLRFDICNEGSPKCIMYHQLIVRLFVDSTYDPKTQQIDHLDRNKLNNSIDNLRVVSKSGNHMNKTTYNGKQAIYLDNIGENIPVNTEHGIYYSKTLDKFFRYIEHTNNYRQFTESKNHTSMQITYRYNNKTYNFNTTKFRQHL